MFSVWNCADLLTMYHKSWEVVICRSPWLLPHHLLSFPLGLSTPVPRGRKGKKGKPQAPPPQTPRADWLASCNPDHLLQEDSYKRHLKHHCNKLVRFYACHMTTFHIISCVMILTDTIFVARRLVMHLLIFVSWWHGRRCWVEDTSVRCCKCLKTRVCGKNFGGGTLLLLISAYGAKWSEQQHLLFRRIVQRL